MRQHRTISTATAVLFAAATILGLAGCGDVNAGSAAAAEFEELMAGLPEVVDVETSSSNTLPWSGTASAAVLLDEGVSDARLGEIVDSIGGFLNERSKRSGGASWEGVDVAVDGFTVAVLDRREDNVLQLDLLSSLREAGVPGGTLDLGTAGEDGTRAGSLALVERDGEDFLDAYDLAVRTAEQTPAYRDAVLTGLSADTPTGPDTDAAATPDDGAAGFPAWESGARFTVTNRPSEDDRSPRDPTSTGSALADPAAARAAFTAVAEQYDVLSAVLSPTSLDLRITDAAGVTDARAVAEAAAGSIPLDLTVEGGIVTWGEDGPSDAMQPFVDAMLAVPGMIAISASDSSLSLDVADPASARLALDALEAQPGVAAVERLSLSGPVGADQQGTFRLSDDRSGVAASLALFEELLATASVASFEGSSDSVLVEVPTGDETSMATAIAIVKSAVDTGTSTQIRAADRSGYWWFEAAETIDLSDDAHSGESAEESAFRELIERLWNAA